MSISADHTKQFARIQRTPEGRLLGCVVTIPAEIVEQYVDSSTETLNFDLIAAPEGIFIEIGGGESLSVWDDVLLPYASLRDSAVVAKHTVEEVQHKKHWQTKLLPRLGSMTRTTLVALFSWVLRELLDQS